MSHYILANWSHDDAELALLFGIVIIIVAIAGGIVCAVDKLATAARRRKK